MTNTITNCFARVAAFAICTAMLTGGVNGNEYVGPSLLPNKSSGFVQIHVDALRTAHAGSVAWELVEQIDDELGAFSIRHLGLDLTQLREVTLLLPPARMIQEATEPPFVAAFTFGTNFSPDDVLRRLPDGWGSAVAGRTRFYTNPNNQAALTFVGARTVLIGSPETLKKWIAAPRGNFGQELIGRFRGQIDRAHVYGVFDAGQVPQELLATLPANLSSLQHAEAVGFAVSSHDGQLDVGINFAFEGRNRAGEARRALQSLVKQGAAALTFAEAELTATIDNANVSVEKGIESLAGLAAIRYGQKKLHQLQFEQDANTLAANVQVDSSLLLFSLAAMGSAQEMIEINERSKFEAISDQLNAVE